MKIFVQEVCIAAAAMDPETNYQKKLLPTHGACTCSMEILRCSRTGGTQCIAGGGEGGRCTGQLMLCALVLFDVSGWLRGLRANLSICVAAAAVGMHDNSLAKNPISSPENCCIAVLLQRPSGSECLLTAELRRTCFSYELRVCSSCQKLADMQYAQVPPILLLACVASLGMEKLPRTGPKQSCDWRTPILVWISFSAFG